MNSLLSRGLLLGLLSLGLLAASHAVTLNAFVEAAAQQNIAEMQNARIALDKSHDEQVKALAQQMLDEHAKDLAALKALAKKLKMDVPTEASLLAKANTLRLESRDESFERIYLDNLANGLEQRLALFKKEANSSENPELKGFAQQALPHISAQLEKARRQHARFKASAKQLSPP